MNMLDTLDRWIDDIPPLPTPQRFGNVAFRAWGKRLEDVCVLHFYLVLLTADSNRPVRTQEIDGILQVLLPSNLHPSIPYLAPYLLTSFGSFKRMDYGTGHEVSFGLFLLCLTLIRFFPFVTPTTSSSHVSPSGLNPPQDLETLSQIDIERDLVLTIFLRYLRLCWRLQDVYRLEPAGSHGVWGLDDSSFLGYIWGSGQLRGSSHFVLWNTILNITTDQTEIPPTAILDHPPLAATNLYFLSISRIHEVKHGPFHEHSSQLHSIAVGVPNWGKVNKGLFLMYEVSFVLYLLASLFRNLVNCLLLSEFVLIIELDNLSYEPSPCSG
jgi:serine/threonine-protein phosphatase 2A activator